MSVGEPSFVLGLDVSAAGVDWNAAKAAGAQFMAHRLTTERDQIDADALADIAKAKAAGLITGCYAFLHANAAGSSEARQFIAALGDPAGMLIALDVEREGITTTAVLAWFKEWFDRYPSHPVVLYGSTYLRSISWDLARMGQLPALWKPGYPYKSRTAMPLPLEAAFAKCSAVAPDAWDAFSAWTGGPTLWQFAGDAPLFGGIVDINAFRGTLDDLRALTGGTEMHFATVPTPAICDIAAGGSIYADADDLTVVVPSQPAETGAKYLGGPVPRKLDGMAGHLVCTSKGQGWIGANKVTNIRPRVPDPELVKAQTALTAAQNALGAVQKQLDAAGSRIAEKDKALDALARNAATDVTTAQTARRV